MAYSNTTFSIPYVAGINESNGDTNLNAYTAPYAQNINVTYATLENARGYKEFISTPIPEAPTRIYLFNDIDTSTGLRTRHIIVTSATKVFVWDAAANVWNTLFSNSQSGNWGFITYQKESDVILIMGNGVDNVKTWNGTDETLSDLAGVPTDAKKCRFFALHYERLWMGGSSTNPNSVWYSRQFDPTDYSGDIENPSAGGGQVDLPSYESGGFVTGLYTTANEIIVMKETTAIRIYGTSPSSYTAYEVVGDIGTKAERAIIPHGGSQYFLTRHGLGVQSGSAVSLLGDRAIPRVFDTMYPAGDGLKINPAYQQTACGTRFDNKCWFALPLGDSTENNALLEYDPAKETRMLHMGLNVVDIAKWNQEDEYVLFVGKSGTDYKVYEYGDSDGYNGKAQQCEWDSAWQDNDKGRRKVITQVRLFGSIEKVDENSPVKPCMEITVETDRGWFKKKLHPYPFRKQPQSYQYALRLSGERFRVIVRNGENTKFCFGGGLEMEVTAE